MFELKVFVDPAELRWAGKLVGLRPKERLLLCRLAFATGLSLSTRELATEFMDRGSSGTAADTLRKHVSNFRRAVRQAAGSEAAQRLLSTEPTGRGTEIRFAASRQREAIGDLQELTAEFPGLDTALLRWLQSEVLTESLSR
jgi:hypothetical protein